MVNIEESLACGQLVGLFDLFQPSDCQKHPDWRTQGEEIHWLEVQRVVDHRHLQNKTLTSLKMSDLGYTDFYLSKVCH